MDARIERVVTSGTLELDGTEHDVENNTWIVGDDDEVIVIDAAHDAEAIRKVIGDREVMAVICTHGHADHLEVAVEIAEGGEDEEPAPIALHPRDRRLWRRHFAKLDQKDIEPDIDAEDGGVFEIADARLEVMHTPGHTPGSICLYSEELGVLFAGDTLHNGSPGNVDGVYADLSTQLNSIGALLGPLSKETRVLPGHGEETTIGAEDANWSSWIEMLREREAVPDDEDEE